MVDTIIVGCDISGVSCVSYESRIRFGHFPNMKAPTRSTQSENPDASSTTTCLFCLEENGPLSSSSSSDAQPPTDHAFLFPCACRVMAHGACLNEWLNGELECPICRKAVQWEWDGDLENPLNEVRRVVYEPAQSSGSSSSSGVCR